MFTKKKTTKKPSNKQKKVFQYFQGDAPACQIELGNKKGGHFFCWYCLMDSTFSSDLTYVLNSTTLSIQERIEKIQISRYVSKFKISQIFNYAKYIFFVYIFKNDLWSL